MKTKKENLFMPNTELIIGVALQEINSIFILKFLTIDCSFLRQNAIHSTNAVF